MEPPRIWRKGELCCVVGARGNRKNAVGNRKNAVVVLASENGKSLAVEFDGYFNPSGGMGGFVGAMPLIWVDD